MNSLTLKQMFDTSEKLIVGQSDEIFGVTPINWENSAWNQLSGVNDEEVISLSHAKVYVFFRFCVTSWKGEPEPNIKYCLGRKIELVQRVHHNTEHWTQLTESRWNSSGIFFWIHHNAALQQSPRVHDQNGRPITIQRTNYLHVDVR